MNIIPNEFVTIRDRLKFLLSGFSEYDHKVWNKKYEEDIILFNIAAKNPYWKSTLQEICLEIKTLLEQINERKAGIFKNVHEYIEFISYEMGPGDWGGSKILDVNLDFLNADDDVRGEWFIKISPELAAYNEMIIKYGYTPNVMRHFISDKLALHIKAIEFGSGTMFISNDIKSSKDFLTLMTNRLLTFQELKVLKIKLGCSTEEGAYILSELNKNNLLKLTNDEIEKYGCFYSKYEPSALLTNGGLRTALSKFKKEDSSLNKKAKDSKLNSFKKETETKKKNKFATMNEIDDCINSIFNLQYKE